MRAKGEIWITEVITVEGVGAKRIDCKIPTHMKRVTGIFFSPAVNPLALPTSKFNGFISVSFNEGLTPPIVEHLKPRTGFPERRIEPMEISPPVHAASRLTGYYKDESTSAGIESLWPYRITIYIRGTEQ